MEVAQTILPSHDGADRRNARPPVSETFEFNWEADRRQIVDMAVLQFQEGTVEVNMERQIVDVPFSSSG